VAGVPDTGLEGAVAFADPALPEPPPPHAASEAASSSRLASWKVRRLIVFCI
jgi:hypothetical protein